MREASPRLVAAVLFGAMFCLFVYKIVMRYAFGDAVAWADELGVLLFIWVIFWGCAFVVSAIANRSPSILSTTPCPCP